MARADYLAELETHWEVFADAGFVERVRYLAYGVAADGAESWASPGVRVDAIRHGDGERREESPAFVDRLEWHLRASQLGGVRVTHRGRIVDGSGATWVLSGEPQYAGDDTDVICQTTRQTTDAQE